VRGWGLTAGVVVAVVVVGLLLFLVLDALVVVVGAGVVLALWTMFRRVGDP
jgi:hypothetical protein